MPSHITPGPGATRMRWYYARPGLLAFFIGFLLLLALRTVLARLFHVVAGLLTSFLLYAPSWVLWALGIAFVSLFALLAFRLSTILAYSRSASSSEPATPGTPGGPPPEQAHQPPPPLSAAR